MKRFFKVVEKDSDGSAKKPRENENDAEAEENKKKEPLKFMTWNANSFLLRVKNNWPNFTNLITTFDPDVIAIQVPFHATPFSFFPFYFIIVVEPIWRTIEAKVFYLKHETLDILHCFFVQIINLVWHEIFIRK